MSSSNNVFIPTLNQMGYAASVLDEFSQAFVDYVEFCQKPVLDIGAGYGIATIPALKKGAHIIANDIYSGHLEILKNQVPISYLSNLKLNTQRLPDYLSFEKESLDAVHVARVFHFLSGEEIEKSLDLICQWLVPNGKVFIINATPYARDLLNFLPLYQKRKEDKMRWPGVILNIEEYFKERSKNLPSLYHVLDLDIMASILSEKGLIIEKMGYIPRPEYPEDMKLDGREDGGVIARKG